MKTGLLTAFWAVSLMFAMTPGADWAYAISAGMRERAVPPAVSGLLLGHLLATVIVAAGIGALIAGIPMALSVLTVLGAGYLAWLGFGLLTAPPVAIAGDDQQADSWPRWVRNGFCVSGINPKVFLLFLALLPQFTDGTAPLSIPVQILALGSLHLLNCAVVYLLVGFGARAVLRARPEAARIVGRTSGAVMIVLALVLLIEALLKI